MTINFSDNDGALVIELQLEQHNRTLREQAARVIRASIVAGRIEPGRFYPVSFFTQRLGVSATPAREALLDLANEGLGKLVRNRGFRVSILTDRDLDEIFALRVMLEMPAVAGISGNLSSADAAELERLAQRTKETAVTRDVIAFLDADRDFHQRLLECYGNSRLADIVMKLRNQSRLYGLVGLAQAGQLDRFADEHLAILLAVRRGETEMAMEYIKHHIEHTRGTWAGREAPGE